MYPNFTRHTAFSVIAKLFGFSSLFWAIVSIRCFLLTVPPTQMNVLQFTTQAGAQSPQALWPAVGRQERLWEIPAVIKFQFPRVCPGNQTLAKEREDSGYEIVYDYTRKADLTKGY